MTDERQMRFEEWADSEGVAQDLGDPERCGDGYMARDWDFLWRLWLARDAEVQALREELLNYVSADEMAVGEGYGTYPNSEHRRIRALVAGEEGTPE